MDNTTVDPENSNDNVARTGSFFTNWEGYQGLVNSLDTYKATSAAISPEANGDLLDIGNGGVVNYDTGNCSSLSIVDLVDLEESNALPEGAIFRQGDACKLPFEDSSFDTVFCQMLLHHLAEDSLAETFSRMNESVSESYRVLRKRGKLVVVESCLPGWLEPVERTLYPLFKRFVRALSHPLVYQFSPAQLADAMDTAGFEEVRIEVIPQGRWIIQLGYKWPTALTPVTPVKITGTKN
jgi:SAM-dependent methyltransferase